MAVTLLMASYCSHSSPLARTLSHCWLEAWKDRPGEAGKQSLVSQVLVRPGEARSGQAGPGEAGAT
jgi:hypothetical protein